jgi:CRP-like cAMP-binding protein
MLTKILREVCFLKTLAPKEIDQLLTIARLMRYKSGDLVFKKEDIGNNFFIVKSGRIKIFSAIGPQKKKTFAYLQKGDFFGEMSLLGGKVRSASAQAMEESELLVISRKRFRELILQNPDFTLKLLHTLVERLTKCDNELESMMFHNILGRLADSIIALIGAKHPKDVSKNITVAIDQNELAEYMGTTRVPVCRAINTLKRSGVIEYKRGKLTVLNMDKLRAISGNPA